jgi:hypothetical protein
MPNDDVVTQPALPFEEDGELKEGTGEFLDVPNGDEEVPHA